jgi:hypothetical protein
MPDLEGQDYVGRLPDSVAVALCLQVLMDGGIGERRVAAKVTAYRLGGFVPECGGLHGIKVSHLSMSFVLIRG